MRVAESDKLEVLDYIRQLQVRREAKQKAAGHTLWILWAALTYLLLEAVNIAQTLSNSAIQEYCARIILLSTVIYFALPSGYREHIEDDDVRFAVDWKYPANSFWGLVTLSYPSLLPAMLLAYYDGWKQASVVIPLIGWALTMLTFYLAQASTKNKRFPFPAIKARPSLVASFLFHVPFIYVAFVQINVLFSWQGSFLPTEELKTILLVLLMFWVVHFIFKFISSNINSQWLDQLERDLIFGFIKPSEALTALERETLGRKISSVMSDHWALIIADFESVKTQINQAKQEVAEILEVPARFKDEIRARGERLVEPLMGSLDKLLDRQKEYIDYLKSLTTVLKFNLNKPLKRIIEAELEEAQKFSVQLRDCLSSIKTEIRSPITLHIESESKGPG